MFNSNYDYRLNTCLSVLVMLLADYMAVLAAVLVSVYFRATLLPGLFLNFSGFYISNTYIYIVVPMMYLIFLAYEGMYSKRRQLWQSIQLLFKICTYVTIVAIGIMYFMHVEQPSRIFVVMMWICSFLFLTIMQYVVKRLLLCAGIWERRIVIVGAGKTAALLAKSFARDAGLGYKIVGLIEDHYLESPLARQYPCLGDFTHIEEAIARSHVNDVVIAVPGLNREELINLVYRIQPNVKNLMIVPDLFGLPLTNMSVETFFYERTILLHIRNNLSKMSNRILKYLFDAAMTLCGLFILLPVMLVIAAYIYCDSPGPVFYKYTCVGKHGKKFICYKFRTMCVDSKRQLEKYLQEHAEAQHEWKTYYKLKNDPRITKAGHFLRKTSLDELPQLLNVLRGEMSLVGPRQIVPDEIKKYGEAIQDFYMVKPGITGLWQVSGRNDVDYTERVQMVSWYVRNWSIWLDMIILVKTILIVIMRKGAY